MGPGIGDLKDAASKASSGAEHGSGDDSRAHHESTKRRTRPVYIKMRPITGMDPLAEAIATTENQDLHRKLRWWRKQPFVLHWAVEIGPWTIELAKHPSTLQMVSMKRTHEDLDDSWEEETGRFQVGETRLSDYELRDPGALARIPPHRYHFQFRNCQLAATKFAMAVSRDPVAVFDRLFISSLTQPPYMDLKTVLRDLAHMKRWKRDDVRYVIRKAAMAVDSQMVVLEGSIKDKYIVGLYHGTVEHILSFA